MKKLLLMVLLAGFFLSCSDDDNGTQSKGTVTLNTPKATMFLRAQRVFHAQVEGFTNTDVNWEFETTLSGGNVEPQSDNYAIFTAPAVTGEVTLVATSVEDPSVRGTAIITVVDQLPEWDVIFDNHNVSAVQSGPTNPTEFTIDDSYYVTFFQNYHYFNQGMNPGTVSLQHEDGTIYGPYTCVGTVGQGGVANAYWNAYPEETIKPGKYTVVDSDPSTWSHNAGTNNCGFSHIEGIKQ